MFMNRKDLKHVRNYINFEDKHNSKLHLKQDIHNLHKLDDLQSAINNLLFGHKLSVQELAQRCDVPVGSISAVEENKLIEPSQAKKIMAYAQGVKAHEAKYGKSKSVKAYDKLDNESYAYLKQAMEAKTDAGTEKATDKMYDCLAQIKDQFLARR